MLQPERRDPLLSGAAQPSIDLSKANLPKAPEAPRIGTIDLRRDPEPPIYCLWRHVASQVPILERKILAACAARNPERVEIYQEAVGGTLVQRRKLEEAMNDAANRHGLVQRRTQEWLWSSAQRLASFIAPSSSLARELREAVLHERMLTMYRRIREETGSEVSVKLVDLHEWHPSFSLVRDEEIAARSYHASLETRLPESRSGRRALLERIELCHQREVLASAAALSERNENVAKELERHLSQRSSGTTAFVIMGAGHVAVSRGGERLLASFSTEIEQRLPPIFRNSFNYDLSLMRGLKAAGGRELTREELRDAFVHRLLQEAILAEAWGKRPPRSADRQENGCELASCLSTDVLFEAGPTGRALLFASCTDSLLAAPSGERAVDALVRPLRDAIGRGALTFGAVGRRLKDLEL